MFSNDRSRQTFSQTTTHFGDLQLESYHSEPQALHKFLSGFYLLAGKPLPPPVQLTPVHTLMGLIWGNTEAVSSYSGILRPDIISL